MRQIQHFFVQADLSAPTLTLRDAELLHQLKTVLRFRPGDACILLDNAGTRAQATVETLHSKEAVFRIESREQVPLPSRTVRLCFALPKKPATLEWILQKATELGVTELCPLNTARCQVHEVHKLARAQLIIKEASEQSESIFLPTLKPCLDWPDFLKALPSGCLFAGDPWTYDGSLAELRPDPLQDVTVVIGPEGGLTEDELAEWRAAGGQRFRLGTEVLRMETAAVAALSVVLYG